MLRQCPGRKWRMPRRAVKRGSALARWDRDTPCNLATGNAQCRSLEVEMSFREKLGGCPYPPELHRKNPLSGGHLPPGHSRLDLGLANAERA